MCWGRYPYVLGNVIYIGYICLVHLHICWVHECVTQHIYFDVLQHIYQTYMSPNMYVTQHIYVSPNIYIYVKLGTMTHICWVHAYMLGANTYMSGVSVRVRLAWVTFIYVGYILPYMLDIYVGCRTYILGAICWLPYMLGYHICWVHLPNIYPTYMGVFIYVGYICWVTWGFCRCITDLKFNEVNSVLY